MEPGHTSRSTRDRQNTQVHGSFEAKQAKFYRDGFCPEFDALPACLPASLCFRERNRETENRVEASGTHPTLYFTFNCARMATWQENQVLVGALGPPPPTPPSPFPRYLLALPSLRLCYLLPACFQSFQSNGKWNKGKTKRYCIAFSHSWQSWLATCLRCNRLHIMLLYYNDSCRLIALLVIQIITLFSFRIHFLEHRTILS